MPESSTPEIPGTKVVIPEYLEFLQAKIRALMHIKNPNMFPGSQPVSFERHHLTSNLMRHDYFVCEKSDGLRCLLYLTVIEGEEKAFFITRSNEYYEVHGMHFPEPENQQTPHDGTVLDGELVYDSVDDNNIMQDLRFLVFDCLAHKKRPLITKNIIGRLGYAKEFVYKPYARLCREFPEDTELFPFKLVLKEMQFSYKLDHVFSEVLPNLRHGSDGLIFTCCETPYVFGTDETLLKWKPAEENSIDFRLHLQFTEVEDEDLPPHHPDRVYLDYDSRPKAILEQNLGQGEYEEFAELSITDAEWEKWKSLGEPLEHRIVEVARNEAREWKFLRFRDDKEDGNYTDVVRKVVASIEDSVKKEELIAAVPQIRENWKRREAERQQRKRGVTEKRPRQSGAEDVNQPQKRRVFDSRAEMQAEEKKGGAEGAEGEAEAEEEDDYEQPEYSRPVDEDYDEDE